MHKGRQTTLSNLFLPLSSDLALVSARIMLLPESGLQNDRNKIGKNIREWVVWARTVGENRQQVQAEQVDWLLQSWFSSLSVSWDCCTWRPEGVSNMEAGHPHFMGGETEAGTHLKSHSWSAVKPASGFYLLSASQTAGRDRCGPRADFTLPGKNRPLPLGQSIAPSCLSRERMCLCPKTSV